MTTRTRTGFEILGTAAVIGVLGNVLLRETPWGLNAFLFVTAFVAGLVVLMKRHRSELLTKTNIALSGAMVFFASMYLIRDAEELMVWDTFAIIILMGVMLLGNFDLKPNISGAFHYIAGVMFAGITSAVGPFVLLGSDIDWKQMPGNKMSQQAFAVLRGLAVALPLLLIFGALFMAADASFEGLVTRTFNFNADNLISHFLLTSLFAWLTAGYFRGSLMQPFAGAAEAVSGSMSVTPQEETRPSGSVSDPTVSSADVRSPSVGSPHVSEGSATTSSDADSREANGECTSPRVSKGATSTSAEESSLADTSSFVAKVAAEPGESGASLPNNASILEHINISDPPDWSGKHPCLPEQEIRTEVGNQEGMLAAPVKTRDWQNLDSSSLPSVFTLGTTETVLILGLVNLLFLAFVIVQVPYLFGGMDLVQNTPDFKLADYARRGFGELVAVAALVLPMLLLSHWLLRKDGSSVGLIYKVFAGIQIALLFVIMASAVQRLVLLTGELGYGMTTVRFYPMVFMTWLAIVFVWFAVTVLRNNRNYFAWGALWSAVFILGATNLMNPEKFIVETNLRLMHQGRNFDSQYNASLGADAVPAMINGLTSLKLEDQCAAKVSLHILYRDLGARKDLRTLNLARKEAWHVLHENDAAIHQVDGCPTWVQDNLKLGDEISN